MPAPAHVIESPYPELFFDDRDGGEFSVILPSIGDEAYKFAVANVCAPGDTLSDLVAAQHPHPDVAFLGQQAVRLNQQNDTPPADDLEPV